MKGKHERKKKEKEHGGVGSTLLEYQRRASSFHLDRGRRVKRYLKKTSLINDSHISTQNILARQKGKGRSFLLVWSRDIKNFWIFFTCLCGLLGSMMSPLAPVWSLFRHQSWWKLYISRTTRVNAWNNGKVCWEVDCALWITVSSYF